MSDSGENGLNSLQWRAVMRRVSWVRFALTLFASSISFAAIGGAYVTVIDARIEQNRSHLERVDATIAVHGERLAGMRASQSATETAAARMEERLSAQAETLNRIESLLERFLSENYGPVQRR